jgi:hypothetical protein
MKPKRKVKAKPVAAQVISLAAYRDAHRRPEPAPQRPASLADAYCGWLALVGAVWALWW